MASIKIYLDTRHAKKDGTFPLKLAVTHKQKSFLIPIGISVLKANWIGGRIEGNVKNKVALNNFIANRFIDAQNTILTLQANGELSRMSANDLKNSLCLEEKSDEANDGLKLKYRFSKFIELAASKSSKNQHEQTLRKIEKFCDTDNLLISNINHAWLKEFDSFCSLSGMKPNGKAVYLRSIRAVINDAIDRDIISLDNYPFRRFKIKYTRTAHRNIDVDVVREMMRFDNDVFLVNFKSVADKHTSKFPDVQKYIDLWLLSFFFCGANIKDVLFLPANIAADTEISFVRAKTGAPVVLRVEPEAKRIIERHRGRKYLLDYMDSYADDDYRNFTKRMNKNVTSVFPGATSYSARHTWATIAALLDVPDAVIDLAQGRTPSGISSIYINRDMSKVAAANRRVLDFLINGEADSTTLSF